jgi:23S rRNA (adenine2503-C2)-methyltransferase
MTCERAENAMRIEALKEQLRAAGAKPRHETLVLRAWARGLALDAFAHLADFPARLRAALPEISAAWRALVAVRSEHPSADGSARLLLALRDGRTIEGVLLPGDGVCVSTQVGCAVGCLFCMTGRDGLERHLGGAEIVAQVALARSRRAVRRVVLMGMGEPAHNLDEVLGALELLGTEGGLDSKKLVFSTVGDRRVFERLPLGRVRPALALSLHTTDPELRARLLPRAPRIEPAELVELADRYSRATGYPIQYQWTLLEGVNDGDDEIERVAALLAGKYAVLNFIPFNSVDGAVYSGVEFRRPTHERAEAITRLLYRRGVLAKLRRSAGQDVEAGCGQLRARAVTLSTQELRGV